MRKALFPGTFDPPTLGHVDIIKRSASVCDKLIIGIAVNPEKKGDTFFSVEEKKELLRTATHSMPHVEIVSFTGLVVDFAKQNQINFLIRGLRAFSDFEYEFRMALANRMISQIETIFLMADEKHGHISSTLIREFAHHKTRLHAFVPAEIEEKVYARLSKI